MLIPGIYMSIPILYTGFESSVDKASRSKLWETTNKRVILTHVVNDTNSFYNK
jgi:hypothetical protein